MKQRLINYLNELQRWYNIVFEDRELELIRQDYYDQKWISKEEIQKLMEYEIQQLTSLLMNERQEKNLILENFNLATYKVYQDAEQKLIKSGRI